MTAVDHRACHAARRLRARRAWLETALEHLAGLTERVIAELDSIDPDADLEPSLGAAETMDQRRWAAGDRDDREGPDADREPDDFQAAPAGQRSQPLDLTSSRNP